MIDNLNMVTSSAKRLTSSQQRWLNFHFNSHFNSI